MVMLDQNVIKHIKKSNGFHMNDELLQQKPSSDQVT